METPTNASLSIKAIKEMTERERKKIRSDDLLKIILGLNSGADYGLKETINELNEMIKSLKDEVSKITNAIIKIHTEKILATEEINQLKKTKITECIN